MEHEIENNRFYIAQNMETYISCMERLNVFMVSRVNINILLTIFKSVLQIKLIKTPYKSKNWKGY